MTALRHRTFPLALASVFLLNALCSFPARGNRPGRPCGGEDGCLLVETGDGEGDDASPAPPYAPCLPSGSPRSPSPEKSHPLAFAGRPPAEEAAPGPDRSRSPPAV